MTNLRAARRREAARITTYFLDESGNTGDVSKTGPRFEFDRQPLFVLACVGVDDVADMAREMDRLRAVHGIKTSELKATSLAAKPLLVIDLLAYLRRRALPLFMEIVDKRFFICMYIVEGLLLTSVDPEFDFSPQSRFMKQTFAECLATTAPDDVLRAYIAACESPGVETVRGAFQSLRAWLESQPDDEVATGMLHFLIDEQKEFEAAQWGEARAVERTLPLPDDSLRGRPVWMLPNLTSFTNIYARLNRYHFRKIGRLILIHDEQRYFEHIMRAGKISAEGLSKQNVRVQLPNADFLCAAEQK